MKFWPALILSVLIGLAWCGIQSASEHPPEPQFQVKVTNPSH